MRSLLPLAGRRLPVDSFFCFSLSILSWLVQSHVFFKASPVRKIYCMASITGSKIVGISTLSVSLFCYTWLDRTLLFQLWTESIVLVACLPFTLCDTHLCLHYSNWCPLLYGTLNYVNVNSVYLNFI